MPGKIVKTPWGQWEDIDKGPGYKIKRIRVKVGHRLSLQSHERRDESWTVVAGEATMTLGSESKVLFNTPLPVGGCMKIKRGQLHRLANRGERELIVIEVQTGECSETDIRRVEDDYGRR